jgi:hypothetical protein
VIPVAPVIPTGPVGPVTPKTLLLIVEKTKFELPKIDILDIYDWKSP